MTTQEKINQKEKELEELKLQLEKEKKDPKQFLIDILGNELTIKIDREKYPNSVFYFKGDSCLLELEKSSDCLYLWCDCDKIWNHISKEFGLKYSEIQGLVKLTVEEHFKMRGVTPSKIVKESSDAVEEHFKMRGVTPNNLL